MTIPRIDWHGPDPFRNLREFYSVRTCDDCSERPPTHTRYRRLLCDECGRNAASPTELHDRMEAAE